MACQEAHPGLEDRLGRDILAFCPSSGDVRVPHLVAAFSACGLSCGPDRLVPRFGPLPPLALTLFPGLLRARRWLVRVLFPCALVPGTRACAQLLPDRQVNGHPVGERTRGVALAAA